MYVCVFITCQSNSNSTFNMLFHSVAVPLNMSDLLVILIFFSLRMDRYVVADRCHWGMRKLSSNIVFKPKVSPYFRFNRSTAPSRDGG